VNSSANAHCLPIPFREFLATHGAREIDLIELGHAGGNFIDSFATQIPSAILADYSSSMKRR
jgi:hypothetical protein